MSVFFLKKLFSVISDNLYYASSEAQLAAPDAPTQVEGGPVIVNAVNPKKVIRGSAFELLIHAKNAQRTYGEYKIMVNLSQRDNEINVNAGEYRIESVKDWPKDEKIVIGPVMVFIPATIPLGVYSVEISLLRNNEINPKTKYSNGTIEVASYSQQPRI